MNALAEIVGDSTGIRRLRTQLEQILTRATTARRPPPVLIRGETGTGKGLVARTMHRAGPRARAPFVDVNCAAIPETLLEAELFGYERGAFTDARQAKPGLFQLAHHGTLFLDEIGMLSPALQAKLLKVLEDGVVRRLGGTRAEPVDVWIVSATNEDLAEALRARRFREDLYHRLAVLSLALPPLRERGADVLVLADRFLARACSDYGLPPKTFARDARAALAAYGWPGNVRELGNVIERVALLVDEPVVTAVMLALPVTPTADDGPAAEPARAMSSRDQMRAHLLEVLTETGGNISQTAVRLGVARNTVLARMARFGLNASTAASPAGSRPGGGPRREALPTAPADVPIPRVAPSRAVWEPRRVALLRVDVGVNAAAGSADASRAIDDMIGKVQTFGGEIVELGQSALVAAFGLEAVEDAPVRAALAALAILKATERARGDGTGPRVKIVVHVAHVLVSQHQGTGTIDLESKRAAWRTIDALVGLDERDTIVVSEASAPFLERRFELVSAGAVDGSGVPFRRLTRRERTGFGLGGRPLSRFVGRDGELRLVTDRLASAARGQGQVIGIVGEPGVGKSRFVYELTRLEATHDWRVLGCGGVSHGSTTPLLPVSDLLRRYFAIEDADGPEVIRERVTETIMSRHEELKSYLTPLLSMLDIAVDDQSWKSLDPPRQRQRIQDAVKRLLLNESRIQPLLLIVEDLHWIDAETQALLDDLVESLPTARLLLLVTYRPEYQQRWVNKTYYSQLRLDALPPESAGKLLHALLGDDPGLEPLTRLLVERGNPFFIEESVRALVETQALIGERGAYRLTRPIETIEVPATVQVILAARIERLSADDKQLLQTASVIGKDVAVVLLHAVADAGEDDVHRGLAHLRAAEFLYETRLSPDAEYTFKHALTQEVAYGTLLPDRRKDLHARIVGAVERVYPDRLGEHVERLAHHALRGELWEKAVAYLRQAGLRAIARAANREAVAHLEQALGALHRLPESRETTELTIDIHLDLRNALLPLGERARLADHLHEAEVLARTLGDQHRLGRIASLMMEQCLGTGGYDEAVRFGQEALSIARTLGDRSIEVSATSNLGITHVARGEFNAAATLLERNVALEGDLRYERFGGVTIASAVSGAYLANVLSQLGRFDEAIGHAEAAVRTAEATDHSYTLYFGLLDLGLAHLLRGNLPLATRVLERCLDLCRTWQIVVGTPFVAAALGAAYALAGRVDQALPLVAGAVEEFRRRQRHTRPAFILLCAGMTCLSAGRIDEAASHAREALALTRRLGARGSEAHALYLAGDVASAGGAEDALGYYREALALAGELGMRPLVAHCHLGLGKLYRRTGLREQAREHLATATTMYREMDMPYWLQQAESETKEMA